jgi:hypothetical protein
MGRDRLQLSCRIAVQHDREDGADKSNAKSLDPMLERQISVATKTGGAAPPRDLASPRRDVRQEDVRAGHREAQRQSRHGEARWAEVDRDQYAVRGQRTAGGNRQHRRSCGAHQPQRRFIAEQPIADFGTPDSDDEKRII